MNFTKKEKTFIKAYPNGINIIRGAAEWSRVIGINKMAYIKNNYCLKEEDKVLYLCDDEDIEYARSEFQKLQNANEYESLFSFFKIDVCFSSFKKFNGDIEKYRYVFIEGAWYFNKNIYEFKNFTRDNNEICSVTILVDKGERIRRKGVKVRMKTIRGGAQKADIMKKRKTDNNLEEFKYIDLRHGSVTDYRREMCRVEEVIVGSGSEYILKNDLKEVLLYSNIAAGLPMEISPVSEDHFYIPYYMLKGTDKCFMVEVRGDSMRDADINDGDYVIVRQQHTAESGDIVAADIEGKATLKRLRMDRKSAYLMPENPRYTPIDLRENEATILGIAVAVMKRV